MSTVSAMILLVAYAATEEYLRRNALLMSPKQFGLTYWAWVTISEALDEVTS